MCKKNLTRKRFIKIVIFLFFSFYLSTLFYLLFFSHYRNAVRGVIDYNLIPFRSMTRDLSQSHGLHLYVLTNNFFGNIFAFLPFGFLLPFLFKKTATWKMIFFVSTLLSLTIETLQFFFRVGAFDVDDILLNTAGGLLGYSLLQLSLYLINRARLKNSVDKT